MTERRPTSIARTRHRLWGALVLLALGVLVLPPLFDGSGSEKRFRAVEGLVDEPPPQAAAIPQDPASSRQAQTAASQARLAEAPRAWVVQAGSFRRQSNALELRDRLRSSGLPCFVTPPRNGSSLFRVNVGPMIDTGRAESVRARVAQLTGQHALLVRYP